MDGATLYDSKVLADAEFNLRSKFGDDEKRVTAHKCILATSSPVFRAMFCGYLAETGVINITDVSAEAFEEFVRLIYVGSDHMTLENGAEVIKLIDKYDVGQYYGMVKEFLHRTVDISNAVLCVQLVSQLPNADDLIMKCEDIIRANPTASIQSRYFKLLDQAAVKNVLGIRLIMKESEKFKAITDWAMASLERKQLTQSTDNVAAEINEVIDMIDFESMTIPQFTKIMRQFPNIMDAHKTFDTIDSIARGYKWNCNIFSSRVSLQPFYDGHAPLTTKMDIDLQALLFSVKSSKTFSLSGLSFYVIVQKDSTVSADCTVKLNGITVSGVMLDIAYDKHHSKMAFRLESTIPIYGSYYNYLTVDLSRLKGATVSGYEGYCDENIKRRVGSSDFEMTIIQCGNLFIREMYFTETD